MTKLLLIDDDLEMLEITAAGFREKGYTVSVLESGEHAVSYIKKYLPDCVILDVMMPMLNGFVICKAIRKVSNIPVIFVTGRVSEEDKVNGLLLGADDYIEKPFNFRELEARVQVAIRRTQTTTPGRIVFPPLEIDIKSHRVLCSGEYLPLTSREYNILHYFVTFVEETITYEDIGKYIWGVYREQDRRSIMVIISRLRKKLEINPVTARMIETVWSKGYKFTGKKVEN